MQVHCWEHQRTKWRIFQCVDCWRICPSSVEHQMCRMFSEALSLKEWTVDPIYTIADRQVYVSFPLLLLVWVKTRGTLVNPKNRLWMDASPLPWYNRFDCSHIWILKVIWVLLHKTDPLEGWTCVIHRRAFAQVQVYMHSSRMLCLLYIFYMSMWIDMTYTYIYTHTYIHTYVWI